MNLEKIKKISPSSAVSNFDKLTMVVAVIALLSSFVNTYFQFFQNNTEFSIGRIDFSAEDNEERDTLMFEIEILFLNTGDNSISVTDWSTFLSPNKIFTDSCYSVGKWGSIHGDNSTFYTFGCNENLNEIIEPHSVKFINLTLGIDSYAAYTFFERNKNLMIDGKMNVGFQLNYVDSKGIDKKSKVIVGTTRIRFRKERNSTFFREIGTYNSQLKKKYKFIY